MLVITTSAYIATHTALVIHRPSLFKIYFIKCFRTIFDNHTQWDVSEGVKHINSAKCFDMQLVLVISECSVCQWLRSVKELAQQSIRLKSTKFVYFRWSSFFFGSIIMEYFLFFISVLIAIEFGNSMEDTIDANQRGKLYTSSNE